MDPAQAKQQIAERVKQASKFLVTVNNNPTVDQLAACIGLTLMLNKMGKHATAVFSGKVPSTIEFLQPDKTLEPTADSLRDFIISLDKNKADKLRYKVEDQYVRIFITPYRTSISEKDLVFSEGDYNVEVVMALGVTQKAQLDAAITAHGRILHDATVVSVNAGIDRPPDIGQINWADASASSLCEMLVSISEALGQGLIDSQSATAFLTGIVSETNRFSNKRTSPKVMTMSAQLMAAGANQQLISAKLEPPPPPSTKPPKPPAPPPKPPEPKKPKQPPLKPEGVLDISHDEKKNNSEVEVSPTEIHIDEQGNLQTIDNPPAPPPLPPPLPPSQAEPASPPAAQAEALPALPPQAPAPQIIKEEQLQPLGAAAPAPSHAYMSPPASPGAAAMQSTGQPEWAAPYDLVPMDPFSEGGLDEDSPSGRPMTPPHDQPSENSVDEIGVGKSVAVTPPNVSPVTSPVNNARSAVENALASAPFDPSFAPPVQSLNAQPLPNPQPIPVEQPPAPPQMPPMAHSDTPMFVLPNNAGTAQEPQNQQPQLIPEVAPAAPPPVPPPLMTAPGAVVSTPSQQ